MSDATYLHGRNGLMLALNVNSADEAKELLERTGPFIAAVKVGWQLMLRAPEGLRVVRTILSCTSAPVLVDAKILDASHIAMDMLASFHDQGARAVTIWGDVGPRVLSECMKRYRDLELFVLTGLTASDEDAASASVASAIVTAKQCGCTNLQVPGNFPLLVGRVRNDLGPSACLVACGIGAQGGDPGEAAAAGANYEIVGRDICLARDPASVAERYHQLIIRSLSTGVGGD